MTELTTPLLPLLDWAAPSAMASTRSATQREPHDDAGDGHAVSCLLAVGPFDLPVGDEAEDDAEDARDEQEESGAATDQRRDRQSVRLLCGRPGLGARRGCRRRSRRSPEGRCRRTRRRRRARAPGTWAVRGRWAVRSRAQAGTTCRRRPTTIQDPVRSCSCRAPSVRAEYHQKLRRPGPPHLVRRETRCPTRPGVSRDVGAVPAAGLAAGAPPSEVRGREHREP